MLPYASCRPSATSPDALAQFEFVGRFLGRAVAEGMVVDATLARFVLRRLLGRRPCHHDLHGIDDTLFTQLDWMLNNDITDLL